MPMRCPTLDELPQPPPGKTGWPWTQASKPPDAGPRPRITIVTPSMNQARFLEETIRSVLLQGYPDLEYMVLDGGSKDGSAKVIQRYEKWLTYWTTQPDHGQADAVNSGWRRATGDILAYINSDDTYCPEALRLVAEVFARDPQLGLVYGRCRVIDEHSSVLRERRVGDASLAEVVRWSPSIPQPTMFVRRRAVEAVGFLRPDLQYTMDYEFSLRIGLKYKWQFIPNVLANMRDHPAAKTAIDPLRHIEEGIAVAEQFFSQALPADLNQLKDKTLATLSVRKARVLSRLGRGAEARDAIARALQLCSDVPLRRKATVAWAMSWIGATGINGLRRIKRAGLQTFRWHRP